MSGVTEALERLCCPTAEVSAHYLISPCGQVFQLVDEERRAWHAGAGAWGACSDVNSRSIGVELANDGQTPFAAPQMDALEELLTGILQRWKIPPERVIAHADMAPDRKSDPGPRFDWRRLALAGLAVWPDGDNRTSPENACDFDLLARAFGYSQAAEPADILAAFRMRFRPWAGHELDAVDLAMIANLANRFPVDGPSDAV